MTDRDTLHEYDPLRHTATLREMLASLSRHARDDVQKVDEPKAQALFETTAEVCDGLATAFDHYENESEPAWRR